MSLEYESLHFNPSKRKRKGENCHRILATDCIQENKHLHEKSVLRHFWSLHQLKIDEVAVLPGSEMIQRSWGFERRWRGRHA